MNELTLSQQDFKSEQIEIRVNQADVIEALVVEYINRGRKEIEEINSVSKEVQIYWNEKMKEYLDDVLLNAVKENLGSCKVIGGWWAEREYSDVFEIKVDDKTYTTKQIRTSYLQSTIIDYKLEFTKKFKGKEYKYTENRTSSRFSLPKNLLEKIRLNETRIEKLIEQFPSLNEKEISKQMRVKFTKEILKSSSSDFKNKLKLGFGLEL